MACAMPWSLRAFSPLHPTPWAKHIAPTPKRMPLVVKTASAQSQPFVVPKGVAPHALPGASWRCDFQATRTPPEQPLPLGVAACLPLASVAAQPLLASHPSTFAASFGWACISTNTKI